MRLRRTLFAIGSAGLAAAALTLPASSAGAATSVGCTGGGFKVTLPNGTAVRSGGDKIKPSQLPAGSTLKVRGKYVEFDVNVSTFAAYDYTLTGAPNPVDLTGGVRTPVFASKVADLGTRTLNSGELEIKLSDSDLVLLRKGAGELKMKIQAKDCATGGIFQMEPEGAGNVLVTHTLSPGMYYYVNPYTGKINFGNGTDFRGKDSPQVATKLSQTDTVTTWSVASGGRMGGVLGEDAVELSAGASNCVQDCQAQNRVRGSLPVTDPAFS
ncbi:hypothetical protein [Motilibacter deserti]|uniref:Uncharacterized protein n=1 Tax=Motilibacter deserti TaxID=2714956 RepID=A0ABX0GVG7_9ACTN|nr:hypothetical protein [Motilibacter deserti]NHC13634.1 hypothetical protein [Motilibacter deserti]